MDGWVDRLFCCRLVLPGRRVIFEGDVKPYIGIRNRNREESWRKASKAGCESEKSRDLSTTLFFCFH